MGFRGVRSPHNHILGSLARPKNPPPTDHIQAPVVRVSNMTSGVSAQRGAVAPIGPLSKQTFSRPRTMIVIMGLPTGMDEAPSFYSHYMMLQHKQQSGHA